MSASLQSGVQMKRKLKNTKRCGERSEAAFLHKASQLGFGIAKPWGDSERYDFILDNGRRLLRVQIKATDCLARTRLRNSRHLHRRQRARRLWPKRHRLPGRARHPARSLVRSSGPRLHARAHAPFLSSPQSETDAPRKIPRSLAFDETGIMRRCWKKAGSSPLKRFGMTSLS